MVSKASWPFIDNRGYLSSINGPNITIPSKTRVSISLCSISTSYIKIKYSHENYLIVHVGQQVARPKTGLKSSTAMVHILQTQKNKIPIKTRVASKS